MALTSPFATLPWWLSLIVLLFSAAYFLQIACNVCGVDAPSLKRSVIISSLVAAVAFFTFDGMGYALVMGMRDITHLVLPPGYGYQHWLREPMYLKWQAMGVVPVLRYIPVVTAICLAGTMYVFLLKDTFRVVMVVVLLQWVLAIVVGTVVATILAFSLTNLFGLFRGDTPAAPSPETPPGAQSPGAVPPRVVTRPNKKRRDQPEPAPAPVAPGRLEGSKENVSLREALTNYQQQLSPFFERMHQHLEKLHEMVDPHLEPLKEAAAPYTRYLPEFLQEFLDEGGWLWVVVGLGGVTLLWARSLVKGRQRAIKKKKKRKKQFAEQISIDLEEITGGLNQPGPNQITVRSFPGRVRLVVLSPASSYVGELLPEMAESLLDWIHPGLGEVYENDYPRVVVWPRSPSEATFHNLFAKAVKIPEEKGKKTNWVVLSGMTHLGRQRIYLGLGVYLDKASYIREIRVDRDKWGEILSIQPSEKEW